MGFNALVQTDHLFAFSPSSTSCRMVPIFEKLEREIAIMRADKDAMGRGKRTAGGMKERELIEVDSPDCALRMFFTVVSHQRLDHAQED